jgi:glutathione S-transferase
MPSVARIGRATGTCQRRHEFGLYSCALSPANASVEAPSRLHSSDESASAGAAVLSLPSAHANSPTDRTTATDRVPSAKVTLYHFPTSLYCQEVRLALAEKGVEWEGVTVNIGPSHEHFAPWYAKVNPRLVVPTLEVDGTIVTDAHEIVRFIDARFEGPALLPELDSGSGPGSRAEVLAWMQREADLPMRELGYARTKGLTRWLQRWSLRQRRKQLGKLRKRNPELDDIYAGKLAEIEALEAAVADRVAMNALVDRVEIILDELEATLSERRWLAGDDYSLADLVWTAVIAKLEHIGFARSLSERRRPRVHEWYTRLRERPSWGAMIRRLSPWDVARFYGPAAIRAFLIFWVLKWALVGGGVYLIRWLIAT